MPAGGRNLRKRAAQGRLRAAQSTRIDGAFFSDAVDCVTMAKRKVFSCCANTQTSCLGVLGTTKAACSQPSPVWRPARTTRAIIWLECVVGSAIGAVLFVTPRHMRIVSFCSGGRLACNGTANDRSQGKGCRWKPIIAVPAISGFWATGAAITPIVGMSTPPLKPMMPVVSAMLHLDYIFGRLTQCRLRRDPSESRAG